MNWHEQFQSGAAAALRRTVSSGDVTLFAGISSDYYGVHTDAEFSRTTRFGRPIAHGAYSLGLLGAAATRLAAAAGHASAYASGYKVKFRAAIYPGDTVEARVEVAPDQPDDVPRVLLNGTVVNQRGEVVVSGTVWLQLPDRPAGKGSEG